MNQTNPKIAFYKEDYISSKDALDEIFSCIEGNTLYMNKFNVGEIDEKNYMYKLEVNTDDNSKSQLTSQISELFDVIEKIISDINKGNLGKEVFEDTPVDLKLLKDIKVLNNETLFDISNKYLDKKDDKSINDFTYYLSALIKMCLILNDTTKTTNPIADVVKVNIIQHMFIDHYAINVEEMEVKD